MEQEPLAPGTYDWLATWRQMYDAEREQAETITPPEFTRGPDFWAAQADRFASAARHVIQPDTFMQFLTPHLHPTDRVIDIGAGTGRYEPYLASLVAEVLALEPSPAMRAQLEQRLAAEPLTSVRILPQSWPATDIPPCDVAIAAHVLYSVRDIGPFLTHMDAIARRSCFLLLTYQHHLSFISAFWERFHGTPRRRLPGALECINALYQLGIPANLTLIQRPSRFSYTNHTEALDDIRWRLRLAPDPLRDQAISAAIDTFLNQENDGRMTPRDQATHTAIVWWEHTTKTHT